MKCLDTYALVEIAAGNPKFSQYLTKEIIIPNELLAEFYGVLLRNTDEHVATGWIKRLEGYGKFVELSILLEAVKFRYAQKGKNFSFFDCVGYMFAQKHKYQFVTGDEEFRGMPGVEFVKA